MLSVASSRKAEFDQVQFEWDILFLYNNETFTTSVLMHICAE